MKDKKIRFIIFVKKGNLPDLISHLKRIKYKGTKIQRTKDYLTVIIPNKRRKELIRTLQKNRDDFDDYELPVIQKNNNQTNLSEFAV